MNAVSVSRFALTSAVRSAPRTTPSTRRQPWTPPATKTVCQFCGARPHQALLTTQNALGATGCILLMSESLGTTRCPPCLKTQCPRTRLMSTLAPLPPVDGLVAIHQVAGHGNQLHVRHIATHHRHTIAKPDRSGKPLPPLTIHSEVRIQDPHTKSWDQCGTIVRIEARHAYRVQLPSGRGCWCKRRSFRPLQDFSELPQRCRL